MIQKIIYATKKQITTQPLQIAVLRANALGDFIFSLPALTALRQTFPRAEITLLGTPMHAALLKDRPSPVDTVLPIPGYTGVRNDIPEDESRLTDFFAAMKRKQFDIAIQMHGGGKYSNGFVSRLGASVTVGFRTPDAPLLNRWLPYIYYQRETLRWLELVSLLGAQTSDISPKLFITQSDITAVEKEIGKLPKRYVIIHPGATDVRRRWSPAKFAAIADFLVQQGFQIVLTGTSQETEIIHQVERHVHVPVYSVTHISLSALVGLLAQSCGIVSNDTGPLHLAESLGVPSVGIYWCANVVTGGPIQQEIHRAAISWQIHCPLCGENCAVLYPFDNKTSCEHKVSFVDAVTIQEVKKEINALLNFIQIRSESSVALHERKLYAAL